MRRALTPPLLEKARPPLARLIRRGWIWTGRQPLDGLFLPRSEGEDRRAELARFLPAAETVLEHAHGTLVLFAAPVTLDCATLGPCLPLRRMHGALVAFPIEPPRDAALDRAITDRLLRMQGGAPVALPLSGFRAARLEDWIDLADVTIAESASPPRRGRAPLRRRGLPIRGDALAEVPQRDAGLEDVHEAVGSARGGPIFGPPSWLLIAAALVAGVLLIAHAGGPSGAGGLGATILTLLLLGLAASALSALIRNALRAGHRPPKKARSPLGRIWRMYIGVAGWVGLVPIALVVVVAIANAGVESFMAGLLILVVLYALSALVGGVLGRLFGLGSDADAQPESSASSRASTPPPASRPGGSGAFWRWLERLLQGSPLTDRALGQYARRVNELERLFAQGRVDEALKKALALDKRPPVQNPLHVDEPIRGPGIRKRLDIEADRPPPERALAALPEGAREVLRKLYQEQAARCAEAGDVERAAFIQAELLGDAEAAVKLFADAGKFETAARLAQGRALPPGVFIPLWARAGAEEHALDLAERYGAYEVLLAATNPESAGFRAEIRRRWSARLAAAGAHREALTVSAPLVGEDPAARAVRLDWMRDALERPEPDAEILARALRALPLAGGGAEQDAPLAAVAALLEEEDRPAAEKRKRLAELLLSSAFEPIRDPAFDAVRLPRLADAIPRRLVKDHARFGLLGSVGLPRALAEAGGQSALAVDLRALPTKRATHDAQEPRHIGLGPIRGAAAVTAAAPLLGGRLLLGYEDGRIELTDRRGRVTWRRSVWRVRDFVTIAPGRIALIIREEPDGVRVSILDADRGREAEIGPLPLVAWSPYAGMAGWLVYDGESVLDLKLGPLLSALGGAAPMALERKWATPITIAGTMLALLREPPGGDARWIFRREDGAVERWVVSATSLQVRYEVIALDAAAGPVASDNLLRFERIDASGRLHVSHATPLRPDASAPDAPVPRILLRADEPPRDGAALTPIRQTAPDAPPRFGLVTPHHAATLRLSLPDAGKAWMREGLHTELVVIRDDLGRVVALSTRTGEIVHANCAFGAVAD